MLLVALFLMVVSLSVWGFTGTVPRHLTLPGVGISNRYDPTKGVSGNPEDYPVQNLICQGFFAELVARQQV